MAFPNPPSSPPQVSVVSAAEPCLGQTAPWRQSQPHSLPFSPWVSVNLNFLFTYWALHRTTPEGARALQMALHTLKMMAHGGIHDHIGQVGVKPVMPRRCGVEIWGRAISTCSLQGFHRYSTDQRWHVPHFEKMLYDQGQLAAVYSRAFQVQLWRPSVGLPLLQAGEEQLQSLFPEMLPIPWAWNNPVLPFISCCLSRSAAQTRDSVAPGL